MMWDVIGLTVLTVFLLLLAGLAACNRSERPWAPVLAGLAVWFGWCAWDDAQPATRMAKQRAEVKAAQAARAETIPHVIREVDGCKVYAWYGGQGDRWHYFTRCPQALTTTENAWEVCTGSGKTRHCETKVENE